MGRGRKGHSGETNATAGWCRGPHCCTFMCKTHPRVKYLNLPPSPTTFGKVRAARCAQDSRVRSVSCSLPSAGITRDLGPHGAGGSGRGWLPAAGRPARRRPRPEETKGQGQRFRLRRGGEGPRAGAGRCGGSPRTPSGDREGGGRAWLTAAASGRRARVVQLRGAGRLQSAVSRKPPRT